MNGPGRLQAVGITQLPIITTVTPGDAIKGLAFFYLVLTPIHRWVIKMILIDCTGITAGEQDEGKQKDNDADCWPSPGEGPANGGWQSGRPVRELR